MGTLVRPHLRGDVLQALQVRLWHLPAARNECWAEISSGPVNEELAWLWATYRDRPIMPYVLQL